MLIILKLPFITVLRCVYGYETVIIVRHIEDKAHNLDQDIFFIISLLFSFFFLHLYEETIVTQKSEFPKILLSYLM